MSLATYYFDVDSLILRLKILDTSASDNSGLTGLTEASTGLVISTIADNEATPTYYTVSGSTIEAITAIGTYAAPTATKCRFGEVSSTYHPGWYEIHLANARYAVTGAKLLGVTVQGAINAAQTDAIIELPPYVAVDANGRGDISKIEGTDATDALDARIDARLAAINLDDQSVPSRSIITGTVTSGGSTTSVPTSAISPSFACLADQWAGSTPKGIYFAADTTTVGLRGVYRPILSHTSGTTPTFTVAALPATPVSGDECSIL